MGYDLNFGWTGTVGHVVIGATSAEGGTRKTSYTLGGGTSLPYLDSSLASPSPLVALEICDDPEFWSPIIRTGQKLLKQSTVQTWSGCI
jgi:acetyl-CoA decarbonylase/synthase complex subunit delta